MPLEVKAALVEEKPILRSHLDDYLSELRRYGDIGVGYPYFDAYWQDALIGLIIIVAVLVDKLRVLQAK